MMTPPKNEKWPVASFLGSQFMIQIRIDRFNIDAEKQPHEPAEFHIKATILNLLTDPSQLIIVSRFQDS